MQTTTKKSWEESPGKTDTSNTGYAFLTTSAEQTMWMEEVDPQLVTSTVAHNNTNDNEDDNEDEYVEDVTPVITRADIQTLNIIPGISL